MIAPDDQQLLAGRRVPPRRIIVHPAVAHVRAIDDGIPKRSAALDDSPAQLSDISIVNAAASSSRRTFGSTYWRGHFEFAAVRVVLGRGIWRGDLPLPSIRLNFVCARAGSVAHSRKAAKYLRRIIRSSRSWFPFRSPQSQVRALGSLCTRGITPAVVAPPQLDGALAYCTAA